MKESQQQLTHQAVYGRFHRNERRKHPRYTMNNQIMSISEDILAEVIDISGSGISCKCVASTDKQLAEIHTVELLNCELGTSVKGLHGRLIRHDNVPILLALPSRMFLNFALEVQSLTQTKRNQFCQFIKEGMMNPADR